MATAPTRRDRHARARPTPSDSSHGSRRDGRVARNRRRTGQPARRRAVARRQQVATFQVRRDLDDEPGAARADARHARRAHRHPIWSPDGARILSLFQGRGIGTFDLVTTSVATGDVRNPCDKPRTWRSRWAGPEMDGWCGLRRRRRVVRWRSGRCRPTVNRCPSCEMGAAIFEARVSPDGRWIAYASDRSGRFEIEVTSFPEPGTALSGLGRGRRLSAVASRRPRVVFPISRRPTDGGHVLGGNATGIGTPAPLFEVRLIAHPDRGSFPTYEYDVDADGSRFLINRMVSLPDGA